MAKQLDGTIERMAKALRTLTEAGLAPRFGDDDGGRLFDGSRNRTEHLSDPLATCALLFGRGDFKAACPSLPEESVWLLGTAGAAEYDALEATATAPRPHFFATSGLASMTGADPFVHQLLVDAGPQGFGNSGHGHADALSLQLIVDGRQALSDPGAFCYPVELPERNLFRGTAAHNTLEVDRLSQAEPGGSFAWSYLPRVHAERWLETPGGALFVGRHDGYERLASPVTHRRSVVSFGQGLFLIRDQALGKGTHDLRLFWHLGPEFRQVDAAKVFLDSAAETAELGSRPLTDSSQNTPEFPAPNGSNTLRFHSGGVVLDLVMERAPAISCQAIEGAWSPCYGRKCPAPVVCCEWNAALPAEFVTVVALSDARNSVVGNLGALSSESAGVSVYRYVDERRCVVCLFCDRKASSDRKAASSDQSAWSWREWSSDAELLMIETDARSAAGRRVFLVGASFLESNGRTVLACSRKVDGWEWHLEGSEQHLFCSQPEAVELAAPQALRFT